MRDMAWTVDAACKGHTDVMYDPHGHGVDLCAQCPVRHPCRTFALVTEEEHGVWGGLRAEERHRVVAAGDLPRHCVVCARPYTSTTGAKYCGVDCRRIAHNEHSRRSYQRAKEAR